jgi:DNA-binding NtrC family response regulator
VSEHPIILFVDDDPKAGDLMLRFCEDSPFGCRVFKDPVQTLEYFRENGADLIVSDLRMPKLSGIELLSEVRKINSEVPVVITTAYSSVDDAIEALRLGATDFIKKPFDMDELMLLLEKTLESTRLKQENRLLKRQLREANQDMQMVGQSTACKEVYSIINKVAEIRCNVIIEGESGTGKELAARAIHNMSPDADKPFIVIDCGALSDTLLESELFGHEKGAFTGATQTKQGLLEVASGGTVFLDEICNISDSMQTKLLRVVQEQQVTRVGGVHPIQIDLRFLVATNKNLEQMVAEGKFRHDLYHRLNVVKLTMPPLRERKEDVPLLVQKFVDEFNQRYHREVKGFDSTSLKKLMEYSWPGNVRELRNLVERNIALADGSELHLQGMPAPIASGGEGIDADLPSIEELERRYILKILDLYSGNREKTADTLGINKSTLWRKLQQYQKED